MRTGAQNVQLDRLGRNAPERPRTSPGVLEAAMLRNALFAKALGISLAASLAAPGCGGTKPEPEIASSAPEGGYAASYPAELQASSTRFGAGENEAREALGTYRAFPNELKPGEHEPALDVLRRADRAGRAHHYVDRLREVEGARAFFEAEEDAIAKKVAGSVQYAVKQKGCDVDVAGTASAALRDSVDKQLDKRRRERSEAHLALARYRDSLDKDTYEKLEKKADLVARASYLVHVELVEEKVRLRRLLEEAEEVKKTADAFIQEERAFQKEPKRTDEEKEASEQRIELMKQSKAQVDSALTVGKELEGKIEERLEKLKKDYAEATKALFDDLEAEAKKSRGG